LWGGRFVFDNLEIGIRLAIQSYDGVSMKS